jgi:hypothetical protein
VADSAVHLVVVADSVAGAETSVEAGPREIGR